MILMMKIMKPLVRSSYKSLRQSTFSTDHGDERFRMFITTSPIRYFCIMFHGESCYQLFQANIWTKENQEGTKKI